MDLSGLACPMPIILAHRQLNKMNKGDILVVKTTDPLAEYDFPDYCNSTGHKLLYVEKLDQCMRFHLKKIKSN